jgi:hypothetical protein
MLAMHRSRRLCWGLELDNGVFSPAFEALVETHAASIARNYDCRIVPIVATAAA